MTGRKLKKKSEIVEKTKKIKTVKLKKFKKPVQRLRTIKKYKKQRCDFIYENGNTCKNYAVGKGTLCKKHGGDPIIKENMIPMHMEKEVALTKSAGDNKFNPAVHPIEYIELSRAGLSNVEIAAHMGTSTITLKNWAEKFESMHLATEIGDALHEAWWIEKGKSGLENRSFNTSLFKFLTSNKLGYSDKMETKSTNLNVHGVLVAPDAVSEDEWENEDIIDVDS